MNQETKRLDITIVSAEEEIYSGKVEQLIATGESGEIGIMPGHTALLTRLKPSEIRLFTDGVEDSYYVSGGMLEVQPHLVTVLADTVKRASDLDELQAMEAKERAKKALADKDSEIDFARARVELAEAAAQLQLISKLRDKIKR